MAENPLVSLIYLGLGEETPARDRHLSESGQGSDDFGGADGALDEAFDSVAKLHNVFTTAMPKADAKALLTVAEDTIKQLGEM